MDRFSAHLDRAWHWMSKGESGRALMAARQALGIDAESPEVHNLLGVIYAMEGDFGEARACYLRAMDLDEYYLDPLLNAAELMIHAQNNPEEAIAYCRQARELIELEEDQVEVILLEADALSVLGRVDDARALLLKVIDVAFEVPFHYTAVGRALLELGDLENAKKLIDKALAVSPEAADARYCRGLLYREEGRRTDTVREFLAVLDDDVTHPAPPWIDEVLSNGRLVPEAVALLDADRRAMLVGTAIHVEPHPTREQVAEELDPRQAVWAHTVDAAGGVFSHLWIFYKNFDFAGIRPDSPAADLAELIGEELIFPRR